ncbi:hypothetical protein NKH19_17060 [Mesorhizobium sp. M1338]|uniref:hypothetical protein n=3 Tax=Mesorhizobium TaxID=68287 RepID=UPI00333AFA82
MVRLIGALLRFAIEPAFIELKAALLAYLLASATWSAAAVAFAGFLFIVSVPNAVAIFEGTKSLWSIYWIVHNSEKNSIRTADVIPNEVLATEYGYLHRAFRFGPFAKNAGNMTILYDSTGRLMDYQCGFNMFGNSYLFIASDLSMKTMPVLQKYLMLHEIAHGSMLGGVIWVGAKWVILSGVVACVFGLAVARLSWFGGASIALTLLVAFVFSRKVVVESAAETFADGYALTHIARESPELAMALIRKLLERIVDSNSFTSQYDRLINKSRVANLAGYLNRLERGISVEKFAGHRPTNWPHYASACLLFLWIYLNADIHRPATGLLATVFALLVILTIFARNQAVRKMLTLDMAIQKMLGESHHAI